MWADEWFETLTPSEKLLWVYLLTNPQTNMLGIYEISLKRISFDTGLKSDQIENTLKGFERVKKAFYYKGHIILTNWVKNQSMNPNMVKSAEKLFNELSKDLKNKLLDNGLESFESLSNGLESLPNASEKGKGKGKLNGKEIEMEFEQFWVVYPKKKNKDKALEYWHKKEGKPPIAEILAKLELQKKSVDWQKDNGQFIPYPGSYINAGGWFDEVEINQDVLANEWKKL